MSLKFGMLAEYTTPADLMHAAEKIRNAGFRRWGLAHLCDAVDEPVPA